MQKDMKYLYINSNDDTLKLILDDCGDISFEMLGDRNTFVIPRDSLVALFFERVIDDIVNCHVYNLNKFDFKLNNQRIMDLYFEKNMILNNDLRDSNIYKRIVIDKQTIEIRSIDGGMLKMFRGKGNILVELDSADKRINVTQYMYPFSLCFRTLFLSLDKYSNLLGIISGTPASYQKVYSNRMG